MGARLCRASLLMGAGILGLAVSAPAFAQDVAATSVGTTNPAEAPTGDIVVTGSKIRRADASSLGPLLTLNSEDIVKSGTASIGELLQRLPTAGVSLNTNGTQGTSYGASAINLRYLGGSEGSGNRVLVLVDGHRWVDGVGQRGFRDFVDLNTMPQGMIDGIEVLKDGASAIYGADAIAGVVNIKTIRPFDGLRGAIRSSITSQGDGAEYAGQLNWGKKWERSSLVLSASYFESKPIFTTARERTALSLVPVTTPPLSPNGLLVLPGLASNAYFGTPAGFASSASPIAYLGNGIGAGALADNSFRVAALPGDFYNALAQGVYSTGPSKRYGVFGRFNTELGAGVNLKIEGSWNKRTSDQLFAPVQLDIGGSAGTVRGFVIPNNHAFNPFGTANGVPTANALAFSGTQAWRIRRVLTAVGNRDNTQDVETWRVAGGLDGTFTLFGHAWNWDVYGLYSRNRMRSAALNQVNYEALQLGLGSPTTCAATPGCTPVDLFGTMTAAQADYIRYNSFEANRTELLDGSVNLTGTLLDLPAGPLAVAMGYEYRENRAADFPDPFANQTSALVAGRITTSAQTRVPTAGRYNLHEVYGEVSIPLLKEQPLAYSLDVDLAARYSHYNTVGGKATLKAGFGYRPVRDILLRGTYSQGFRAPSILELYQGERQTNFQGVDPCNGGAAANASLPGCAGVPAGYNQSGFNAGLIQGTVSGNAGLKPETADTYSAGLALTPSFLPGLSLTVDYYKIRIRDAIALQSSTQIMQLCAVQGGVFCNLVQRDATNGSVVNLIQASQNLSSITTDGIDATLRYDRSTAIGRIGLVLDASYLNSFRTVSPNPAGGAPIVDERAGKGDQPRSTYPRWKGQAALTWSREAIDAALRARYIGGSTDVINTVKDARTRSTIYTDLEVGFGINEGQFRLALGVNNLFDVQPPASYANAPINYDIYTYDARGRMFYARASVKL